MSRLRILGWIGAALLAAQALRLAAAEPVPDRPADVPGNALSRLLGPAASLAATVQWIRVGRAFDRGADGLAFARAETALALDPGATGGWDLLASRQALHLGSVSREPDPARRLAWLRAGLATARRGEAVAREPAALAFLAGVCLLVHAEQDPDLPWPGGAAGLWQAAAGEFERAAALGHPHADGLAASARERAAEAAVSAGR